MRARALVVFILLIGLIGLPRAALAASVSLPWGVVTEMGSQSGSDIAWGGSVGLAVWQSDRDIEATLVNALGNVITPSGFQYTGDSNLDEGPQVAWNGSSFLVVFTTLQGDDTDVVGFRISPTGERIGNRIEIGTSATEDYQPAVASDGVDFMVVWKRSSSASGVWGARVLANGTTGTPFAVAPGPKDESDPAIAYGDDSYLVVWSDTRNGDADIRGGRLSRTGGRLDASDLKVSVAGGLQLVPALAWHGTRWVVAWSDFRNNSSVSDIYATRVGGTGTVWQPDGIPVARTAGVSEIFPDVATTNQAALVSWEEGTDIQAARLDGGGTVLDPGGFVVAGEANRQSGPASTFGPSGYLVTWNDARNNPRKYDLWGTSVGTDRAVRAEGNCHLDPGALPRPARRRRRRHQQPRGVDRRDRPLREQRHPGRPHQWRRPSAQRTRCPPLGPRRPAVLSRGRVGRRPVPGGLAGRDHRRHPRSEGDGRGRAGRR